MATGEHVLIVCPHCQREFSRSLDRTGKTVQCPGCRKKFHVRPLAATEETAAVIPLPEDAVPTAVPFEGPSADAPPAEDSPSVGAVAEAMQIDFVEIVPEEEPTSRTGRMHDPDGAAVVGTVQTMIREGLQFGASRILLLPLYDRLKVVYRIDDAVVTGEDRPLDMLYPVMVRLMTMTNLSGFIKIHVGQREKRLHASFKPAREGLSAIIDMGHDVAFREACRARAERLGYRYVDLTRLELPKRVLGAVPEQVVRENRIIPVAVDGDVVTVAICDPNAQELLDRVRFLLNRPITAVMASEGAILAAIDRYYGHADPEAADLFLWELAQVPEQATPGAPAAEVPTDQPAVDDVAVEPLVAYLRTLYRDKMFHLFDDLQSVTPLCRRAQEKPVTAGHERTRHSTHDTSLGRPQPPGQSGGDLEVEFPHAHVMGLLPDEARGYIENKIWVLREAILSRLENFFERDHVARGVAMTYAIYAACRRLAAGQPASINPVTATDAWINFLCAFSARMFPAIQSNGALLRLVTEHPDELSATIASLLDDPEYVRDPAASRAWLARLSRQTTTDEPVDFDSPAIVHLLNLVLAEALHIGASRVILLPHEECVEVACRVQTEAYRQDDLPLARLFPLLARLCMISDARGEFHAVIGEKEHAMRVALACAEHGPAACIELLPDAEAVEACRQQAAAEGFPFVDLAEVQVPAALIKRIPKGIAWKKKVLPLSLEEGATLVVASGVVPTPRRLDEMRLLFNRQVSVQIAPESEVLAAIYRHYHPAPSQRRPSAPAAQLPTEEGKAPRTLEASGAPIRLTHCPTRTRQCVCACVPCVCSAAAASPR